MAQIINTNIASLSAQRNLNSSQGANSTALERLSSGLRINSAKDDAAGLAISTRFESQTKGLNQAVRNAGDGISLAQTAEGSLQSMTDNLQRIRELSVQSANGTNSDDDRVALQAEVSQLVAEIERTSSETEFNGRNLFDGNFEGLFQIGANAGQTVGVEIGELTTERLGSSAQAGVTAFGTNEALSNGDLAINGTDIGASRAADDTASTSLAAASGIAKAEAINRYSDETGVSAVANENVAAGSIMAGEAAEGNVTINGVAIEVGTTSDTNNTRASVAQAINAASDQTGVKAVNTDSSAGGVQLIAEDGRNIEISFGGDVNSQNTGLAETGVYTGGYTLVADGDRDSIEITGGDGTGLGNLQNAGLTEGTYNRATAVSVAESQSESIAASTVSGGTLNNVVDRADNNVTTVSGGTIAAYSVSDDGNALTLGAANGYTASVAVGGDAYTVELANGDDIATAAQTIDDSLRVLDTGADLEGVDYSGAEANKFESTLTVNGEAVDLVLEDDFTGDQAGALASLNSQIEDAGFGDIATASLNGNILEFSSANGEKLTFSVQQASTNAAAGNFDDLEGDTLANRGGMAFERSEVTFSGMQFAEGVLEDEDKVADLEEATFTLSLADGNAGTVDVDFAYDDSLEDIATRINQAADNGDFDAMGAVSADIENGNLFLRADNTSGSALTIDVVADQNFAAYTNNALTAGDVTFGVQSDPSTVNTSLGLENTGDLDIDLDGTNNFTADFSVGNDDAVSVDFNSVDLAVGTVTDTAGRLDAIQGVIDGTDLEGKVEAFENVNGNLSFRSSDGSELSFEVTAVNGTVPVTVGTDEVVSSDLEVDDSTGSVERAINGEIAFKAGGEDPISINISEGDPTPGDPLSNELIAGTQGKTFESFGDLALSTTDGVDVNVTVGNNEYAGELAAGATVSTLADFVNSQEGVNAWEDINMTLTGTNLESGDNLAIAGVNVGYSSADAGDMAGLVDDINGTDFSSANVDVAASLSEDGQSISLNVRNFSGEAITMQSDNEGRRVDYTDGQGNENSIQFTERQLAGELAFSSNSDDDVQVSVADPDTGDELFVGNSATADYDGVNGLENGDLVINGVTIDGASQSADTASAVVASDGNRILSSSRSLSAIAVAASVNDVSNETGVTAEVNATEVVGGNGENSKPDQFAIGDQADIYINGVSVGSVTMQEAGSSGNVDTDRARSDALNLINENSGKTGVVGEDNGVSLTLSAQDGRNVSVAIDDQSGSDASIGALFGLDSNVQGIGESTFGEASSGGSVSAEATTYETTYGSVSLSSASAFEVDLGSNGAEAVEALGLKVGTFGGGEDGQFLKDIDISTQEGANDAITAVDNALESVSSVRSDLGAIQNRFESTISNLEITAENLTAANSRIRDADFAAESAELSRTQVLQQAGISILAQANQRPQQVLSLLG